MGDKLNNCAIAYERLIGTQYEFIIGRKCQLSTITLNFSETEFVHLTGLHKLIDNDFIRTASRNKIFEYVLENKLLYNTISKSVYFSSIENRLEYFVFLEEMLDNNDIVFKYNSKKNVFSQIKADYLLQAVHADKDIYIFLDRFDNSDIYFCRSFFPKEDKDYTIGQAKWTLLLKKKINLLTGESVIQYDRLNK